MLNYCHLIALYLLQCKATYIPAHAIPQRNTRQIVNQNDRCFVVGRCSTEQFSHSFVPYSVHVWNSLPNEIVNASNIDIFKSKLNKFFIQSL